MICLLFCATPFRINILQLEATNKAHQRSAAAAEAGAEAAKRFSRELAEVVAAYERLIARRTHNVSDFLGTALALGR